MSCSRLIALAAVTGTTVIAHGQLVPRFLTPQVLEAGKKRGPGLLPGRKPTGSHRWSAPRIGVSNTGVAGSGQQSKAEPTNAKNTTTETKTTHKKDGLLGWLSSEITDRITVTGNRTLGYHNHRVWGDEDAFSTLNYYGMGASRFTDTGNMNVTGKKVLGVLDFDMAFTDNHYNDPLSQHVTLTYERGPLRVLAGDIRGTLLNTNPYASINKSLKGAMAQYSRGRFSFAGLHSSNKGTARTVTIQGTNSAGPYYLQSGRVVADSVQVEVDGTVMRLSTDYVVNTDIGAITFINKIIAPTSTIAVSFESYSVGATAGNVDGAAVAYDFGRWGRVGLTGLQQTTGLSNGSSTISQQFWGYGTAGAQYWLDYEPLSGTVIIKVDGVVQTEGTADSTTGDYYFDSSSPYVFYFRRAVATTQIIDVTYVPKSTSSTNGDRKSWGIDYKVPLGRDGQQGYLQYAQATGELDSATNPMRGTARGINGTYRIGDLKLRGSYKDIPGTYVTVQSSGFQRNERASEIGLDYNVGRFSYKSSYTNSSVDSRNFSGTTTTGTIARLTNLSGSVSYTEIGGTTWSLSHTMARNYVTSDVKLDTTDVTGSRQWGRLNASTGAEIQNGYGPVSDGSTTTQGNVSLLTYHVGTTYQAGEGFGLSARGSVSSVKTPYQSGTGTDLSLGLSYHPGDRFTSALSFTQSDSGAAATLGNFGTSYGYGTSGFSGGSEGSGSYGSGANKLRQLALTTDYQLSQRVDLSAHASSSQSEGSLSTNARTTLYGVGVDLDLGNYHQLGLSVDQTSTEFLTTTGGNSDSTSLALSLNASPAGRWYYRLGVSKFLTQGSSSTSTDTFGFDTMLGYKLGPKHRLSATYHNGYTTGVYGQTEDSIYVDYAYQLFQNLALGIGYKYRDVVNTGSSATTGAYRSSGLDIELRFDFR